MFIKIVSLFVAICCSSALFVQCHQSNLLINAAVSKPNQNRTFVVDWEGKQFLKDGEPFRFIAGSFHYFRAHPGSWQRKLRTMRAAGLNAVTTYVEWSLHNPKDGQYVWEGIADLEQFLRLAQAEDLFVILRPGPYICAERDMGGFPYWLLTKYPGIQLRTADINYLSEVRIWYAQLMSRMESFLYGNNGPIILVQVENEYGSYFACDKKYREWLRDETKAYVNENAVLFTNDGPSVLRCGKIDKVLATLDFGATNELNKTWAYLQKYQPNGPLVNAEFYPGWLTHWGESMARVSTDSFKQTFIDMLDQGANVNFYMWFGGTNFGFTAGANDGGAARYNTDITSYDYDAPMNEAGDPTEKYYVLREIIGRYESLPKIPVPEPLPKRNYGTIRLTPCCSILSNEGRTRLAEGTIFSIKPLTFEAMDQNSGFLLYETNLPKLVRDPSLLEISDIRDRAYVFLDRQFIGILSRENLVRSLPIYPGLGSRLQILVENQGRINYNVANDFKGILSDVFIDKKIVKSWNITKFPLESYSSIRNLIDESNMQLHLGYSLHTNKNLLRSGPTIFYGQLTIRDNDVYDTYLDPTGWSKGLVFINGFNLGRYWPIVGPQVTLYVPKEILKAGSNQIVVIEYQNAPECSEISFTDVPNLDGLDSFT